MRIIGGKFGGRVLKVPEFAPTRPTTNIAKEALFNMLENFYNFENVKFLDLFGGTGQLSFEMATFVAYTCYIRKKVKSLRVISLL